jgi:hypothetical protein
MKTMRSQKLLAFGAIAASGILAAASRRTERQTRSTESGEYEVRLLVSLAREIRHLHSMETKEGRENGQAPFIARYAALAMHERHAHLIANEGPEHVIDRLTSAIADLNHVQGLPRMARDMPYRPSTSG